MAQEQEQKHNGDELPENAFRPLALGEEYHPLMSPQKDYPEVTFWSVWVSILMAVIFSPLRLPGLKIGRCSKRRSRISIIAVGLSSAAGRKKPGTNVIIQSIGACSGDRSRSHSYPAGSVHPGGDVHPELAVNFLEVFSARCWEVSSAFCS